MALAIRFDELMREGVPADQADTARLGHVTRARVPQIMNLLNLAPDIQEAIFVLPPAESGKAPITGRDLRPIAAEVDWRKQWGYGQDVSCSFRTEFVSGWEPNQIVNRGSLDHVKQTGSVAGYGCKSALGVT